MWRPPGVGPHQEREPGAWAWIGDLPRLWLSGSVSSWAWSAPVRSAVKKSAQRAFRTCLAAATLEMTRDSVFTESTPWWGKGATKPGGGSRRWTDRGFHEKHPNQRLRRAKPSLAHAAQIRAPRADRPHRIVVACGEAAG